MKFNTMKVKILLKDKILNLKVIGKIDKVYHMKIINFNNRLIKMELIYISHNQLKKKKIFQMAYLKNKFRKNNFLINNIRNSEKN